MSDLLYFLLGIPHAEHPPNAYRLLGLSLFESDPEVIQNSARKQSGFVSKHTMISSRFDQNEVRQLLEDIQRAKKMLMEPARREEYDRVLRQRIRDNRSNPSHSSVDAEEVASSSLSQSRHADIDGSVRLGEDGHPEGYSDVSDNSPQQNPTPAMEWLVGTARDATLRYRLASISRRHCTLRIADGRWVIEDCDSLNGTYLNGIVVDGPTPLLEGHRITLGRRVPFLWPLGIDLSGYPIDVYLIGRGESCDLRINDETVSEFHAQVLVSNGTWWLQDLKSRNGTRVGTLDNRVTSSIIQPHLSIYFGRTKLFGHEIVVGLGGQVDAEEC